ncbi:hypothetical protein IWQ60_011266 [Tieghemiomyces parasiticus]|uniref:C2H2-type domain-containing protein n=1 Tax=Tieghemiomyces parasiticus TaxID=78921 RepID=A0A9W8DLQ3_9FUNG|nr:hypothetical protein IWQ60_011266 [Tieghemiomyces parasiticus]
MSYDDRAPARHSDYPPGDSYRHRSRDRNEGRSRDRRSRSPGRRDDYSRSPRRTQPAADGDHYVPNYDREGYTPAPRYKDRPEASYGDGAGLYGRHPGDSRRDLDSPMDAGYDDYGRASGRTGSRGAPVDPAKLDYMVTLKYFTDYHRSRAGKHYDADEVDDKYQLYKQDFRRRQHQEFFNAHKDDDWFVERYQPAARATRQVELARSKIPRYEAYMADLAAGQLDDLNLDEAPQPPSAAMDEDTAGRDHRPGGASNAEAAATDEETWILFIKTIPPSISRRRLEDLCAMADGYQYLALSEPIAARKFHRFGWVKFVKGTDMERAQTQLDRAKIDEFQFHFGHHRSAATHASRGAFDVTNTPERLEHDAVTAQRLIETLDAEANAALRTTPETVAPVFDGNHLVNERTAVLGDRSPVSPSRAESDAPDLRAVKRRLDLRLEYLRRVHLYCYYCGTECESQEDFVRKCGTQHYRRVPAGGAINRSQAALNFLAGLDDKLAQRISPPTGAELARMGGRDLDEELESAASNHIEKIEEGKFRCALCSKLFKGQSFVVKHIRNKHPDAIKLGDIEDEVAFFNHCVRDARRFQAQASGGMPGQVPGYLAYISPYQSPSHMMMMGGGGPGGYPAMPFGLPPISQRLGNGGNPRGAPMMPGMMPNAAMFMGAPPGFGMNPAMMGMMAGGNGSPWMGGGYGHPGNGGFYRGNRSASSGGMMGGGGYGRSPGGGDGTMLPGNGGSPSPMVPLPPPPGVRADPRQMRSYVDLDAPAQGDADGGNSFL